MLRHVIVDAKLLDSSMEAVISEHTVKDTVKDITRTRLIAAFRIAKT